MIKNILSCRKLDPCHVFLGKKEGRALARRLSKSARLMTFVYVSAEGLSTTAAIGSDLNRTEQGESWPGRTRIHLIDRSAVLGRANTELVNLSMGIRDDTGGDQ